MRDVRMPVRVRPLACSSRVCALACVHVFGTRTFTHARTHAWRCARARTDANGAICPYVCSSICMHTHLGCIFFQAYAYTHSATFPLNSALDSWQTGCIYTSELASGNATTGPPNSPCMVDMRVGMCHTLLERSRSRLVLNERMAACMRHGGSARPYRADSDVADRRHHTSAADHRALFLDRLITSSANHHRKFLF